MKKCQRFVKLKELQTDTQAKAFAAHLILPPDSYWDTQSTHHPTSGQVTI
jgi:hypothetical protein